MTATDRYPLPREAWYVGAPARRLAGEPLAAQVFEHRIVLMRDTAGAAFALQDRCPHRGLALSLGRAEDGKIACGYHGWRFGRDGLCAHIPSIDAEQRVPANVAVRSYPCAEQDGYVWIWMGEGPPQPAAPRPIADFAGRVWLQGQIDLACEAMLPIENNLDLCHPYFAHPGLHPQYFSVQARGFQTVGYELKTDEAGLAVHVRGMEPPLLRFELPDRVTVAAGSGFVVVVHHTPMGPGRCRQHWLLSHQAACEGQPHGVGWTDDEPEIFAQDRRIMESAQLAYEAEGDDFERSVRADAPTLAARRIVRWASQGRWPAEKARMPDRRLIEVRS